MNKRLVQPMEELKRRSYGLPDKYIKVICAMYEKNVAVVMVGNEARSWLRIESRVKPGCFLSPFTWSWLIKFLVRKTALGEHGIKNKRIKSGVKR